MFIRLRLALWYGGLFAVILFVVSAFSYAVHARGHYDDLDRALITTASHMAAEARSGSAMPPLLTDRGGFQVVLRLYAADGTLLRSTSQANGIPPVDPRSVLAHPSGPAFDPLAGLAPPIAAPIAPRGSAFGLTSGPEGRWRLFVLPVAGGSAGIAYVEAMAPPAAIDQSMFMLRLLLAGISVLGLAVALAGSCLLAGRALRPIARMIAAADGIAASRDLSQRLDAPRHADEIGRLGRTFNKMLTSIESAYRAQQRFVADASHELRAPLTAIQANLELLQHHAEMPEEDRVLALAEAQRESERLTRLVADLLALARADAGIALRSTRVDLDGVVLEVFSTARQLANGQSVVLDAFEPLQVCGDEDRLKQLLLILLDNALKYTPAGGMIVLSLRRVAGDAQLLVRDTGPGIPEKDLPHVFERFYRADPARGRDPGGTGLGLAIAEWIVRQHGGHVALSSRLGAGTTVTVRLPLADGVAAEQ